jgi:DNA-binding transcriptional regulator GbsR (MarR family)
VKLTPLMERYVLHWGEMGTRWGVNRTVAQIHALLYLSPDPLPADEIAETLAVARSNVSTSLKELQAWGLVTITHTMGDRRDHFTTKGDTWSMLTTIVAERKRRELEPTLSMLRQCMLEAENDRETPAGAKARIEEMQRFIATLTEWFDDVKDLPRPTLVALMKMGAKIAQLLPKSVVRRLQQGTGTG